MFSDPRRGRVFERLDDGPSPLSPPDRRATGLPWRVACSRRRRVVKIFTPGSSAIVVPASGPTKISTVRSTLPILGRASRNGTPTAGRSQNPPGQGFSPIAVPVSGFRTVDADRGRRPRPGLRFDRNPQVSDFRMVSIGQVSSDSVFPGMPLGTGVRRPKTPVRVRRARDHRQTRFGRLWS